MTPKLVLVTGAGAGIGRATVLRFAAAGAAVIAADIDAAAAEQTATLARHHGVRAWSHQVDVADAQAMESFAGVVRDEHGVPDVIVNNAGIGLVGPILATSTADWERLLGVNLWGVIHGCRLFGAQLVERGIGGHIVNIASAAAFAPSRVLPAYATSKAAVLMLSECLRVELAPHHIGVSVICPGLINTGIVRSTRIVGVDDVARQREHAARLYARRNYGPDRVAAHIFDAVRDNRAVVPVTAEAHALRALSRISPAGARVLARAGLGA